jgi:hypothetical protein
METEITINSISSLCSYIKEYKPDLSHLNEILWHIGICAIIIEEAEPETYCHLITKYWTKWHHTKERPIFIDTDVSTTE